MLTWWGIMLDVMATPYRGGVLCLRGGAFCSASVWRIHHSSAYRFASVSISIPLKHSSFSAETNLHTPSNHDVDAR